MENKRRKFNGAFKAKVATREAYGFKVFKTLELALYHNLGALPEPKTAHRFLRRGFKGCCDDE